MLTIPLDTVAWIIVKAREYHGKAEDTGDGAEDPDDAGVLQDRRDDPSAAELRSWIADLTDTEAAELTALMWLGRGDEDAAAFPALVDQARAARGRRVSTARYLMGEPMLGDFLEEALEALGFDTSEIESALR